MKKFTRILALLLALTLCLSFVACGDDEETNEPQETRYTITEEEWEAFVDTYENVTIKTEIYAGDEYSQEYVVKMADGYTCWCGNDWSTSNGEHDHTTTTQSTTASRTPSSGSSDYSSSNNSGNYPNYSSSKNSGSNDYPNYSSSRKITVDLRPVTSIGGMIWGTNDIPTISVGDRPGAPIVNMVVSTELTFDPNVDYWGNGTASGWIGNDILQLLYQFGNYVDADGEKYNFGSLSDFGTGCVKEYKGKTYYELEVKDEDGKYVTKWVERTDAEIAHEDVLDNDFDFDDLKYDEKEKAYVYKYSDKENGFNLKSYFYFENGLIKKTVAFSSFEHDGKEAYDVSKVKPNQLISDEYSATVQTYKKHGETKVKGHSFSKDDIITKVKK